MSAYYSTVIDQPADEVWGEIRDFGNYRWVAEVDQTGVEGEREGVCVGAVRFVTIGDRQIRQRLLSHSDIDRSYSYDFADRDESVPPGYLATIRVVPVTDGNRSLVEWSATFDAQGETKDKFVRQFESSFAGWFESLRTYLQTKQGG